MLYSISLADLVDSASILRFFTGASSRDCGLGADSGICAKIEAVPVLQLILAFRCLVKASDLVYLFPHILQVQSSGLVECLFGIFIIFYRVPQVPQVPQGHDFKMDSYISPTMAFMDLNFVKEMFIIILKRSRALMIYHVASP